MMNLKLHKTMKNLNPNSKEEEFYINIICHMINLFDKKNKIDSFSLIEDKSAYGRLLKKTGEYRSVNNKKQIWKSAGFSYELKFTKEEGEKCYDYYQKHDDVLLHTFEDTILHELCHLKYFSHGKRFFRCLNRYVNRWVRYKTGMDYVIPMCYKNNRKTYQRYRKGLIKHK